MMKLWIRWADQAAYMRAQKHKQKAEQNRPTGRPTHR